MITWILSIVVTSLCILFFIIVIRTVTLCPKNTVKKTNIGKNATLPEGALERLSGALQIETISCKDYKNTNFEEYERYIKYIEGAFPLFHKTCQLERINEYSLVYCWKGKNPDLRPMMFTAHYDVVPIESGTENDWTYPGFSGKIAKDRIWGRGALDIKSQMIAHMEAAEKLMRENFIPERDYLFVYGHDEEVGGLQGAQKVVETFEKRGLRLEGVLDEGGVAIKGMIPGVEAPIALVGIAEKGYCDYELKVDGDGGHTSMPPKHTALGKMAAIMANIENNPTPARLTKPIEEFLKNISGELSFPLRAVTANLWLFRSLLLSQLSKDPTMGAMIRSSCAVTMAKASDAANVLPQNAEGVVNVRLLPGDTSQMIAKHFENLGKEYNVSVTPTMVEEATEISSTDSLPYKKLFDCIASTYPSAIATPYLVLGGTDCRKYSTVCDNIYRFTPLLITSEEMDGMHSTDESVSIEAYGNMVAFFEEYMKIFDK